MQLTIFEFMNNEDREKYAPKKSDDWKWTFADYPKEKNGLKVFSCFACGGGSTMGYKLAGCDVVGCCEIDPKMNEVYVENHHPKYNYLMDIRDFNKLEDLPTELYDLDILDGSPPCTTFSVAGLREETWGKKKKFREGQVAQTLDDLSFIFIDTVKKLRPKVVIMENVQGLLVGEAWTYVERIYADFKDAGYKVNHWLLKGENMGVPQTRHRVFFIAIREDLGIDPGALDMSFNYIPVNYGEIKAKEGKPIDKSRRLYKILLQAIESDKDMSDTLARIEGKENSLFSHRLVHDDEVMATITAKCEFFRFPERTGIPDADVIASQTFPTDYNFMGQPVIYVCGMSVPPIMIKRIVMRLIEQGVFGEIAKRLEGADED